MMTKLDLDFVRSQFPAFQSDALRGQAFFENAGGSYTCQQVIARLRRFYHHRKTQPYGPYSASALGGEEMDEAAQRMSALLGLKPASSTLCFGPSTSQNTYVLANAFRTFLTPGDALIVTNQDHEANSGPWRRLEASGIEIREWQINQSGQLEKDALMRLLDNKVRLVCFPHCSNIFGEINDVAGICALIREAGAYSCVDGVSFAPHGFSDIGALGADIYLFSAYKTFGPHQGLMAISNALLDALPNQGHYFNAPMRSKRLTPAGPDHAQIAAVAGIADYIDALAAHHFSEPLSGPKCHSSSTRTQEVSALMRAHEGALLSPLLGFLANNNRARLLGPSEPEHRAPTIALDTRRPPSELNAKLAKRGIMAGAGNFYAYRPLKALGIDPKRGVLRLSFVHYTHQNEVEKLIEALEAFL